jgi:hypothetical protein
MYFLPTMEAIEFIKIHLFTSIKLPATSVSPASKGL